MSQYTFSIRLELYFVEIEKKLEFQIYLSDKFIIRSKNSATFSPHFLSGHFTSYEVF